MRTLIIGCGYVGEALGRRLIALGHDVTGIRRSSEHNDRLARLGIRPVNLDITDETEFEKKLDGQYDRIVLAASSTRGGKEAYRKVYGLGSKHVAQWLKTASAQSVVLISSTSVYGKRTANGFPKMTPTPHKTSQPTFYWRLNRIFWTPAQQSPFFGRPGFTARDAATCSYNS